MSTIAFGDFVDSNLRVYLEQKFNGQLDVETKRFYMDINRNGYLESTEYVNLPIRNDRLDYNVLLGDIGKKLFPQISYTKPAAISMERKRGLTPREYQRKVLESKPAAKFTKGATEELGHEVTMMATGASQLFDTCGKATTNKFGIKSGPFYAGITSGCFAGGIAVGFGSYILTGQFIDDAIISGSDIFSGNSEKMGRGTVGLGILALQFLPFAKLSRMKIKPTGGITLPSANSGALALAGGSSIALSGTSVLAGTASMFSVGSKSSGSKGSGELLTEKKLAKIIKEHDYNLDAVAFDSRVRMAQKSIERWIKASDHPDMIGVKEVLAKRESILAKNITKKPARTMGREYSDDGLAEILDIHNGDFDAAAYDLNMYTESLKRRTLDAKDGSKLAAHKKSLIIEAKPTKRVLTDKELYNKLCEWEDSGNISGILADPDVGMTKVAIRLRIMRAKDGHPLKEFKGTPLKRAGKGPVISDPDLAYLIETNKFNMDLVAKTVGISTDAIYKKLKQAPVNSDLGRVNFIWREAFYKKRKHIKKD